MVRLLCIHQLTQLHSLSRCSL